MKMIIALLVGCFSLCILKHAVAETAPMKVSNVPVITIKGMVAVKSTAIQAIDGTTLGFAVEVINLETSRQLCLVIPNDINGALMVEIYDEKGYMVNFSQNLIQFSGENNYHNEIIYPRTSHTWFVQVPKEMVSNLHDPMDQWKPCPIAKGNYEAILSVNFASTTLAAGEQLAQNPKYDLLNIDLPKVAITIDPANSNIDLLKAYINPEISGAKRK